MYTMSSVVFVVLVSFLALAAGVDNTPFTKVLSTLKLTTKDTASDILILQNFLLSCPAVAPHFTNCLVENNYNDNPGDKSEECKSERVAYNCWIMACAATTCPDKQEAIDALGRLESLYVPTCDALGNDATSVVAGFLTLIVMTCVSVIY